MSSKQQILAAIRKQHVPARELPNLDQNWITYGDPLAQFASMVESVGGSCLKVESRDAARRILAETPAYASAKETVSLVPGIGESTVDLNTVDDPHQLETIDLAIATGQFAVAENGAVWVTGQGIKHRAILFLCQHLVLVVPVDQVLHNMHQAYERLVFCDPGFGVFISGPSKTADIEQSLVIGAHGPRSLRVLLLQTS